MSIFIFNFISTHVKLLTFLFRILICAPLNQVKQLPCSKAWYVPIYNDWPIWCVFLMISLNGSPISRGITIKSIKMHNNK